MAKYLALGGRLDSITLITGSVTEVTTAGRFDTAYADAGLSVAESSTAAIYYTLDFTDDGGTVQNLISGETGYFHCEIYATGSMWTTHLFILHDSSGFPWLGIRCPASGSVALYYNSNTGASPTWTKLGTDYVRSTGRDIYDIKLTIGSPHSVEFSINNSLHYSGTFTQANLTTLRSIRGYGPGTGGAVHSQIMATEGISTIGAKVKYSRPSGAGATNTFTSAAYTNVNEAINSDATFDQSAAAAQKVTYAMGDVTVPAGMKIGATQHCIRGKNDGAAPTNLKSVARSGGTDYASSNLVGIGTSYKSLTRRLTTDPNTAAEWSQSGFNSSEWGYESVT